MKIRVQLFLTMAFASLAHAGPTQALPEFPSRQGAKTQPNAQVHGSADTIDLSAHRGDKSYYRENTISAFRSALASSASSIEFDVHLTADEVPVIYHDYSLNPKDFEGLEKPVLIKELTFKQLMSYRYRTDKPLLAGDDRVATLAQYLQEAAAKPSAQKKILHVEIKSEAAVLHESAPPDRLVMKTLEALQENPVLNKIVVRSFNWDVIEILRMNRPEIERILLVDRGDLAKIDIEEAVRRYQPSQVSPNFQDVTKEIVNSWKAHGIGLSPWTVNDPKVARTLIEMGVVGFATDQPHLMASEISRSKIGFGRAACYGAFTK